MKKTEGRLTFEFRTAHEVQQLERQADPLKCADFVAEEEEATWMIEVTDALRAPAPELRRAIRQLAAELGSGRLAKDMLMKLYGTHAHLAATGYKPGQRVHFAVIVGLPRQFVEAAARNTVRDQIERVVRRVGPSFHGLARTPILEVESIETWNVRHPDIQIS